MSIQEDEEHEAHGGDHNSQEGSTGSSGLNTSVAISVTEEGSPKPAFETPPAKDLRMNLDQMFTSTAVQETWMQDLMANLGMGET